MILNKTVISKYFNAYSLENTQVLLDDELENIKNGKYKIPINKCRDLVFTGRKAEYNSFKKQLPAITFSGIFNGAHKKENLLTYSQLIVIDIDNLAAVQVEDVKKQLSDDKYIYSVWISPSGEGLKLLIKIKTSSDEHSFSFLCLSEYFKIKYQIEIDKSGSDICRLCFISYDENLLINNHSVEFDYKEHLDLIEGFDNIKTKVSSTKVTDEKIKISLASQKALFWATEGKNKRNDRSLIEKIIKYLNKNNQSITSTYNDWFRVAIAIANTFTYEVGLSYFIQLCELDKENHDEYKSKSLLEYCYINRRLNTIGFSSIIYLAKNKGFK